MFTARSLSVHSYKVARAVVVALVLLLPCTVTSNSLPLPKNLVIPNEIGSEIARPHLKLTGGPLVVSNSPEQLTALSGPSALFRANIKSERFRVFFHHQNSTQRTPWIGTAITNPSGSKYAIDLRADNNSQCLPGEQRSTVHPDPATAGWVALRNWFVSSQKMSSDRSLKELKPGETCYVLQQVQAGATVTGMCDFSAKAIGADGAPEVTVTVLACDAQPANPEDLPLLAPVNDASGWHRRGVFPHSERSGTLDVDVTNPSWLDVAGPESGKYCRLMKNEMEPAQDDPHGRNPGNYGVIYSLRVRLRNPSRKALRVHCMVSVAGGAGFSTIALDGTNKDCKRRLPDYGSWIYKDATLAPGARTEFTIKFSLPGGCSGAHRLYFWPEKTK